METDEQLSLKNVRILIQTLEHSLLALAASLEGRLTPAEKRIMAQLFEVQTELQILLLASPSLIVEQDTDMAYAQAMQYARDLVKTMRQKEEHQRRLELTSQQLIRAEKLATVGQIAAAVAHELGNILTPLLMYARLIYDETVQRPDMQVAEFAHQITKIASRASDMLCQLVDAARNEPGMMMSISLPEVIQNALTLLDPQIKKQGIVIHKNYPDDPPLIQGNPEQLEQVFINLSLNAFDAMPEGGHFTITLETTNGLSPGKVKLIIVRLEDTGMGIPPENIGFLFEPFFTTKERGAGSGLGLFVSHLIVDQHGGAIEVSSEPGRGTTFVIKLPPIQNKVED